ncbi:intraflagellar transport-associated protein isoform X2 [Columba livia]|uniref:intraflagellar transport-associated protein isoform X2 n=1 Tax=Columba livia TaxID=8932 RepID=UPI0031BB75B4
MGEQLSNNSILDQFSDSHEQSYEEFLNTFTYLLKDKEGKTIQGVKADSLRKTFSTSELSNGNKNDGSPERSKEIWVSLPPQMSNKNEAVMSESWKARGSDGNNLSLSERVKNHGMLGIGRDLKSSSSLIPLLEQEHLDEVTQECVQMDKCLDLEDTDTDEETCSGSLVLPGEVEQTVTSCTPFFDKPIQVKFRTSLVPQPSDSKAQELLWNNVQPFSLDEEFDYDNVALTPKFSEAELKSITELSEEKKMRTDVKSA